MSSGSVLPQGWQHKGLYAWQASPWGWQACGRWCLMISSARERMWVWSSGSVILLCGTSPCLRLTPRPVHEKLYFYNTVASAHDIHSPRRNVTESHKLGRECFSFLVMLIDVNRWTKTKTVETRQTKAMTVPAYTAGRVEFVRSSCPALGLLLSDKAPSKA